MIADEIPETQEGCREYIKAAGNEIYHYEQKIKRLIKNIELCEDYLGVRKDKVL